MSKASGVERAGGDCLEDFDQLREDAGLSELLGHGVPSAEAARKFFYQFHDGEKIEQAQQALAERVSYIREENPALQALAQVNQDVVREPKAVAGMASGQSGLDRGGPRRHPKRTGRRSDALRTFRGQCGLVAAGRADLQRADRSEAAGAAARVAYGSAQATAFSDLQYSREISASRAPYPAAIGLELAAVFHCTVPHACCPCLLADRDRQKKHF